MINLEKHNLWLIAGGNPYGAVMVGVGVYTVWPSIADSTSYWGHVGQNLSEWTYNTMHPNELGPMEYSPSEFGYSYIAPASPDEFPPHDFG